MPLPLVTLKPSFYNHYTSLDGDRKILFNKFWGSVAVVDCRCADAVAEANVAAIPLGQVNSLVAGGFLVEADLDERTVARERYQLRKASNSLLGITIELTQECNLVCTFCYQNSYRGTGEITDLAIERVEQYIATVVAEARRPIQEIALRFIGGEPLMQKKKILVAIKEIRSTSESLGVTLNTQVDTNGLLLDEAIVREMDATSITITNKADHDNVRVRHNGAGSYDQILRRIRRHAQHYNEYQTVLAVRYNVNAFNAKYISDVYRMVKSLGIRYTQFDVFNTVNYDYNLLIPTLTSEQFKRLYLDVIKLKVEHGEVVTDFPRPTFSPCSAYTPYNLKITADGRLALCDAMTKPRASADELLDDVGKIREIFADVDAHDPFQDPQCGSCSNVGICGGKLYCKPDPCDFLPFDMDEFLRFFVGAYPAAPNKFDLGLPG